MRHGGACASLDEPALLQDIPERSLPNFVQLQETSRASRRPDPS